MFDWRITGVALTAQQLLALDQIAESDCKLWGRFTDPVIGDEARQLYRDDAEWDLWLSERSRYHNDDIEVTGWRTKFQALRGIEAPAAVRCLKVGDTPHRH